MADTNNDGILYLFDRPAEPSFAPKGEQKVAFEIPAEYLVRIILLFILINIWSFNFCTHSESKTNGLYFIARQIS